jgi:hypothetical protein
MTLISISMFISCLCESKNHALTCKKYIYITQLQMFRPVHWAKTNRYYADNFFAHLHVRSLILPEVGWVAARWRLGTASARRLGVGWAAMRRLGFDNVMDGRRLGLGSVAAPRRLGVFWAGATWRLGNSNAVRESMPRKMKTTQV